MRFVRATAVAVAFGAVWCAAVGSQKPDQQPAKQKADIKAGAETYSKYCASCHGKLGKGDGPVAEALKIAPSDLTALARTYDGKFPRG